MTSDLQLGPKHEVYQPGEIDLTGVELRQHLDEMSREELLLLRWRMQWRAGARLKQVPPDQYPTDYEGGPRDWTVWGIRSGRGFGKTLSAANWIGLEAVHDPGSYNFVIAPTYDDVRYTCFQGPTGLFSVIPEDLILDSNLTLPSITVWTGGEPALIRGFAADAPERLRGPQCNRAWCDEVASWRYPEKTWDNLIFGLRLGTRPRICWTGTLKPKAFIRALVNDKNPKTIVVQGSTDENKDNLTDIFYDNVAKYRGTAIGRQELEGELLDPEEAGFIKRSWWNLWPADKPLPTFLFILYSLDTAFTEKNFDKKELKNDPTACSVWGLFMVGKEYHVMLLDCWEDYLGFPQLIKRVKTEREYTYGDSREPLLKPIVSGPNRPRHQGRRPDKILIEDKGSGISLRQSLAAEEILTELYNPGQMDKLSRLHAVSPMFAHRRVWAIESESKSNPPAFKSWADPLISQVCTYVGPGSVEHDDLLDTTTQALKLFMDGWKFKFTVRETPEQEMARRLAEAKRKKRKENPYG